MSEKIYIIDSDEHLGPPPKSGREYGEMIWGMDEEGALIWPDEYAELREEFDSYQKRPETALNRYEQWRLAKLLDFFTANPDPPKP